MYKHYVGMPIVHTGYRRVHGAAFFSPRFEGRYQLSVQLAAQLAAQLVAQLAAQLSAQLAAQLSAQLAAVRPITNPSSGWLQSGAVRSVSRRDLLPQWDSLLQAGRLPALRSRNLAHIRLYGDLLPQHRAG